jgi:cytochrome c peroxidase
MNHPSALRAFFHATSASALLVSSDCGGGSAEVLRFYSTRNSNPQRFYGPSGVPNDLPAKYLGNIETSKAPFNRAPTAGPVLTEPEVADLVAFLRTLSDGFRTP